MYWPTGAPRIYAGLIAGSPEDGALKSNDEATPTAPRSPANGGTPGKEAEGLTKLHDVSKVPSHASQSAQYQDGDREAQVHIEYKEEGDSQDEVLDKIKQGNLPILDLKVARQGHLLATITCNTLTVWQTGPVVVLAAVVRSSQSVRRYGPNVSLLLRPDSAIFVVHTAFGYLITYSLAANPDFRAYKFSFPEDYSHNHRRQKRRYDSFAVRDDDFEAPDRGSTFREISLRFRLVIRVDAGVSAALALDDELVVATLKPPAVQCIRWTPDSEGKQTTTELLSRMPWLPKKTHVVDMAHDRPMNLSTWITTDGSVHAVQRNLPTVGASGVPPKLFRGYSFYEPETPDDHAVATAINARFSLIAVGTKGGDVHVHTARNYDGNIPFSHRLQPSVSASVSGGIRFLSWSPDGHCLFAGLEKGWTTWSVFGKPGANSFNSDPKLAKEHEEAWLGGVRKGSWLSGGSEMILVAQHDVRLWALEFARSAVTGCFSAANISRSLLHTKSGLLLYKGYDLPDLMSISAEAIFWDYISIPAGYLADQAPIRSTVISPDGRYIAVAGQRGLLHYSVHSGRWKAFEDKSAENGFLVRGGMCWYQHILIAAVETDDDYEIRLYSRELALDEALVIHTEQVKAPIVVMSRSGDDSLLVYTHDNILYHYVIAATSDSVRIVQVGQIAFHGIVRAPARVRAMSWIVPDHQLQDGDPSHDVTLASVLFLVDGKLALLQPSTNDSDAQQRYDMRILAQNVEYYIQMRDQLSFDVSVDSDTSSATLSEEITPQEDQHHGLQDSLWIFDGTRVCIWTDIRDILASSMTNEAPHNTLPPVRIPLDFYPNSVLLKKGIILGLDPEFIQRRGISFAFFRMATRAQLFLPEILRHYLAHNHFSTALHLSHHYKDLLYFPHALEILLHIALDEEAEKDQPQDTTLLPSVLSFLSSFPQYLDIIVQCTRKTEIRSWRTLFAHLPPPQELFEQSLEKGLLKTAGGYLLVLHNFEDLSPSSEQSIRLFSKAKEAGDWDLCKELARFLMLLDESGMVLRDTLRRVGLMDR